MTIAKTPPDTRLDIARVRYHGWPDCCVATNGIVEAVVVPAVGRVMQFRFAGDDRGVFWENRSLDGHAAKHGSKWMNFGGDKAWPAPQENWGSVAGRAWPPPQAFDSLPYDIRDEAGELIMISPVDPNYGIQVIRRISLAPKLPVMTISTRYSKLAGAPVGVGVWIVTQLRDPQAVFALLPDPADGFRQVAGPRPLGLKNEGRLLSLRRDPEHNLKIAMRGAALAWMDEKCILRIQASSPDACQPCSTAVYTNKDPLAYVELETETSLERMTVGDHLELTNTYTLTRRSVANASAEACNAFGLLPL